MFAYNGAVIRSTNKTHCEIVYGHSLYLCVDLLSLPFDAWVSESPPSFTQHIHDLHAEMRPEIALSSL